VEASLRTQPRMSFELVDPATRLGKRRSRARSGWSSVTLGGRAMLLDAKDEGGIMRLLEAVDPGTLAPVIALHVTAGSESGIAASVSIQPGDAARGLLAIRSLGERLTG
jgi:hypothetical protein